MTGGARITFTPLAQLTLPSSNPPPSVHQPHGIGTLPVSFLRRTNLEKCEPTISYEAFVEDLDTGDSFTTTLMFLRVRVRLSLPPYALIPNRQISL
jgi:hypothetical protein